MFTFCGAYQDYFLRHVPGFEAGAKDPLFVCPIIWRPGPTPLIQEPSQISRQVRYRVSALDSRHIFSLPLFLSLTMLYWTGVCYAVTMTAENTGWLVQRFMLLCPGT